MPPFVLDYYKREHIAQVRAFTLGLAIKVLALVTLKKKLHGILTGTLTTTSNALRT